MTFILLHLSSMWIDDGDDGGAGDDDGGDDNDEGGDDEGLDATRSDLENVKVLQPVVVSHLLLHFLCFLLQLTGHRPASNPVLESHPAPPLAVQAASADAGYD